MGGKPHGFPCEGITPPAREHFVRSARSLGMAAGAILL